MHQDLYLTSPILQDFRLFYRELLALQNLALEHPVQKMDPLVQDQSVSFRIRRRLEDLLTNQYRDVGNQKGGYAAHHYKEAQYIMVALADEIFINLNWSGNEEWKDNLLESLMYNTQDSGDKFFENLESFLNAGNTQEKDMASLYLVALGLGFKGRYRGDKNENELFSYRSKLYRYIASEDPALLENRSPFFPQAYENIIDDRQTTAIPDSRPWWLAIGVIMMSFIAISSIIWLMHMHSFSPLVKELEKWSRT